MQSMNGWVKARYIVTWMDACYWIQFPQSVNLTQLLQRQKKTSSSVQGCQNSDLNCRKTEKSSQTKLATGACKSWIFFAVDNFPPRIPVTIFPLYLAPVAGQPGGPLHLARAVRAAFTGHVMLFSSLVSQISDIVACWFRQKMLQLIQKYQGSSSSFSSARFTGLFLSDLCLCAKAYVIFVCGRGEPRVFVSSEVGPSVWRDMRVPVCLSVCFCGLNLRTLPQLSLNKFRAPLGYRGLVLGLNVSCFFSRSLGTSSGARAEQNSTKPGSRRHNYVTKKLRAPVSVPAFYFILFSCSRWSWCSARTLTLTVEKLKRVLHKRN